MIRKVPTSIKASGSSKLPFVSVIMSRSDPLSKRGKPPQQVIETQKANLIRAIAIDDNATVLNIIRDKFIGPNAEIPQRFESGVFFTLTPLYEAAKLNRPEICELLLQSKAEPYAHPVYNLYPLHCACNEGHVRVVEVFTRHLTTELLNYKNTNGDTPLHIAALRGHLDCVKMLLLKGANACIINSSGKTAAHEAAKNQHYQVVEYINSFVKDHQSSHGDLQTIAKLSTSPKREFPCSNGIGGDELVSGYGDTCKPTNPALHRIQMLPEVGKTKSERFEKSRVTPPLVKTNSVESPTFPRKLHGAEFVAPTKQRVKLDKLSEYLFTSLSYISLSVPGQPYKNPMLQACKKMFRDFHMEYCFTLEQYESLMDVALPVTQSYIESTSISVHRDTLSSRKEWTVGTDFSPPDFKPLNQKSDGKREGISSLVFKVDLLKPEIREKHGKTVVLKMLINITDTSGGEDTRVKEKRFHSKHWNEYSIQAYLPPFPYCMPLIHYYTGSTKDFEEQIRAFIPESKMRTSEVAPTTTFLVMPACRQTLLAFVREKAKLNPISPFGINEDYILSLIAQLLLCIAHMRRYDIAHRDIKADNVFILDDGNFMLGDFGHAKSLKSETGERILYRDKSDARAGNAHAWSPEISDHQSSCPQIKCKYLDDLYDKSDVYAVGRMIFHLFYKAQSPSFPNPDKEDADTYYKREKIPNIPNLSAALNALLVQLVRSQPKKRFSALQGASVAFVILFQARLKSVKSLDDCHRWLFAEGMEIYLNGCKEKNSGCYFMSSMLFSFLTTTNPSNLWNAIEFVRRNA